MKQDKRFRDMLGFQDRAMYWLAQNSSLFRKGWSTHTAWLLSGPTGELPHLEQQATYKGWGSYPTETDKLKARYMAGLFTAAAFGQDSDQVNLFKGLPHHSRLSPDQLKDAVELMKQNGFTAYEDDVPFKGVEF